MFVRGLVKRTLGQRIRGVSSTYGSVFRQITFFQSFRLLFVKWGDQIIKLFSLLYILLLNTKVHK